MKQGMKGEKFILRHWCVYLCHLKISELEPQYQKFKGRVVLRGDIVSIYRTRIINITNDGSKDHAHYIKTTPGCAGQATDAVSAYTQVKK